MPIRVYYGKHQSRNRRPRLRRRDARWECGNLFPLCVHLPKCTPARSSPGSCAAAPSGFWKTRLH